MHSSAVLIISGAYPPSSDENGHQKRNFSKTLSTVDLF